MILEQDLKDKTIKVDLAKNKLIIKVE
jgi:hypothetical protein